MLPGRQLPPATGGFAVVDIEATGRSPWRHRVVEVAVVSLDSRLRTEGEFSTLIDPAGPVGPTHVHRIRQQDVIGAPRFREVAPQLLELLAGRVLVGHHVSCDQAFLEREFVRIGVALPPVPLLCTMGLARTGLLDAGGYGLAACVEAAGLGWYPAHTALGDARAAADLLRHCVRARSGPSGDSPSAGSSSGGSPSADWVDPLREAARVPWPRLARPASQGPGRPVPLIRREAPFGPWPLGTEPPGVVLTAVPTALGSE